MSRDSKTCRTFPENIVKKLSLYHESMVSVFEIFQPGNPIRVVSDERGTRAMRVES